MAPPIKQYVDVNVLVEGAQSEVFNFGSIMGAFTHTNGAQRLMGPYSTTQELTDAGFDVVTYPEIHNFLATVVGQENGVKDVYIGLRLPGDATWGATLDAIEAVDADAFFGVCIESRSAADIIQAMTWVEQRNSESLKVGAFQSAEDSLLNGHGPMYTATVGGTETAGDYEIQFAGFGLGAPVDATFTRVAEDNDGIAAGLAAAITALIATTLSGVVETATATGAVVTITLARDLATGTLTPTAPAPGTLVVAQTDYDVAAQAKAGLYQRSFLVYGPTGTGAGGYKDAAALSRGLGFRFDEPAGAGVLAYKQLKITPFTPLSPPQAEAIRGVNANYHGRKFGLAFFWDGITPAGEPYFFDIATSLSWFIRRSQEAIVTFFVGQATKVGYSRAGILKTVNVVQGVADNGVRNGHFLGDPGFEPYIAPPKLETVSVGNKKVRVLSLTSTLNRMTMEGAIQKIELTMRVNFGPE